MGSTYKKLLKIGLIFFIMVSLIFGGIIGFAFKIMTPTKIDTIKVSVTDTLYIQSQNIVKPDTIKKQIHTPQVKVKIEEPVMFTDPVIPKIETVVEPPKNDTTTQN